MAADPLDDYIVSVAKALGLRVEDAWRPAVRANLEVSLRLGRLVDEFTLPDETLVYPGHDYRGARVSCIAQEKLGNPRFSGHNRQSFIEQMAALQLPRPEMMDEALPANLNCGRSRSLDVHGA